MHYMEVFTSTETIVYRGVNDFKDLSVFKHVINILPKVSHSALNSIFDGA